MEKLKMVLRNVVMGAPLVAIVTLSLLPIQILTQQVLIMFTLLWLDAYIFFNILCRHPEPFA